MTKFFLIILLFFFNEKSLHGDTVIFIEEGQALSGFPEAINSSKCYKVHE